MKKETIKQAVAPYMAELTKMADRIYDLAEPGLEEVRSSAILTDYLEKKGFQIERGSAGLPTAFRASMNRETEDLPLDSWQSTTH